MTSSKRLTLLLAALGGVGILRWADPLGLSSPDTLQAVELADRPVRRALVASLPVSTSNTVPAQFNEWPVRPPASEPQGNPFALRAPPPPPELTPSPPPPPPPSPVAQVVVEQPAPQPLPLQVIGVWKDGQRASVFFAGPNGTLQGHAGDVLLSDYRIDAIDAQFVRLTQVSSSHIHQLALPVGANAALASPPSPPFPSLSAPQPAPGPP